MYSAKIKFLNVTKEFRTKRQRIVAVKDYSMDVEDGEFISVIGPSGCGKSTIIRMIANIIKPTSGNIFIDGEDYSRKKIPKDVLRKIGFIFQQPNLLPWLTVRQNVELPLKIFNVDKKICDERVSYLLDMVNLSDYGNSYPLEVSGGMTQRIGVIRAMVHDPEILLMDEPFGSLDGITREQLNIELHKIWLETKKTIIFITHNVEEAVLLSQKVYVMGTQPGRLTNTVEIDLPADRTLDMINTAVFQDFVTMLTNMIGKLDISAIK